MHAPLSIGVICHPTYGGSGVVASELALTLAELGHEVHLFSHEVPPRLARASGLVQMHRVQGAPYPLFHSTPHDLAIASAILTVHRATGLDILHAHYALPHAVSGFLARAAAQSDQGRPAPRLVTTLHGTDITLVGNDPSYAPLTQFVIQSSDAATAVSKWLAQRTKESFLPCAAPGCEVDVIPNFVDTERFSPKVQCSGRAFRDDLPTAVHVSNFRPVKRVPWLIEAFALAVQGRAARLLLVGDGPDMSACRALVSKLGIDGRVTFLGERDALPELLAPAQVFALSSDQESFGLSALEAMSCGTPVVATDAGGVSEVVTHGLSGLLSALEDKQAFANNLRALLFDDERSQSMGEAARADALARFQREPVVERYAQLYRRVLGR